MTTKRTTTRTRARRARVSFLTHRIALAVWLTYMRVWSDKVARALVPGSTVALLSNPSKMPGKSFGLPARLSCPRANGSICDNCYADNGAYKWRSTKFAQMTRFKWTIESMRTPDGRRAWVYHMICAISGETYFRIHDSGDFFNVEYAKCWLEVIRALPGTKFWAPTRAWQLPNGVLPVFDPLMGVLRQIAALPNVTVRPSALDFGDLPPVIQGLHAGSSAAMSDASQAYQCPARAKYDNTCGPCRHCWEEKSTPVNYAAHAIGKRKLAKALAGKRACK